MLSVALAFVAAQVTVLPSQSSPVLIQKKRGLHRSPNVSTLFKAVGGSDSACRGESASDNRPEYYLLYEGVSPEACMSHCVEEPSCKGIEHNSFDRCELWVRPSGIGAFANVPGYNCLRYTEASADIAKDFVPVDGADGRACRGLSSSDNQDSYYELFLGIADLESCMAKCIISQSCRGIEYSGNGRCEVWTRPDGIQASATVNGYQCWRYAPTIATTMTTSAIVAASTEPPVTTSTNARSATTTTSKVPALCSASQIQRRRRQAEMCSCRRRSGTADLASGWICDGNTIRTLSSPSPSPSSPATPPPCSAAGEDCQSTSCCSQMGYQCYEKDQYWASCRDSCEPGINPSDPPEYQTPWSCKVLGTSPSPAPSPITVPSTTPVQTPTTTISPSTPAEGCVELLVMGDYGTRNSNQRRVAAGLAAVAEMRQPAAIAGIGDNIYGDGAEGNPQLIVDWWRNVYLQHASLKRPWYIVTGNHDWYTDARTERDFTTHPDNTGGYWRMPDFWYKQVFRTELGVTVDAFFIDTQIWRAYSTVVEDTIGTEARQQQMEWLTAELAQSAADWKIIFGHHPVYSAGSHGISSRIFEELDPLMRQYGVQIMFAGHDHSKQLMQHRGLNYVISGAGGATARSRSDEYPVGSQKYMYEDHGFVGLSICNSFAANLTFYSADGQEQATAILSGTPPDPTPEPGKPALANGDAGELAPVCGGVVMRDVDLVCPSADGSGCRVLADQMSDQTCRAYCARNGLGCKGGWEEEDEDCTPIYDLGCDQAYGSTSDLICECMPVLGTSPSPAPSPITVPSTTPVQTPTTTISPSTPAEGCVELLVMGDYGTRNSNQRRVAAGLAAVAEMRQPAAIAGIGDNIYGDGAEGNPQLIVDWWRNVYLQHASLKRPWYIVTGNHDWYTDARTERDFTTHPDNTGGYWRMPDFWYKQVFRTELGVTVDAFFIDTQIWRAYSTVVEDTIGTEARQQQMEWLTAELAQSAADWKIIFGHHPVYSAGSHGISSRIFEELDPLMRQYGVQIMFAGHDHSKQLMQHRGLNYVISGAGGATARSRSDEYPVGSQKYMYEDHGFVGLSICNSFAANLTFYSADGQEQATAILSGTPPDPTPEPGKPALANGDAGELAPVCGGVVMRDVDLVCPSADGSGCRVLADQMSDQTCRAYCARNGLGCKGGWEEEDEDCTPIYDLGCDQAYGSTSDLICECMP
eukprot:TRINITY_DN5032_c0_g1_i1.p1 TRINITY_DN5032_c0_g1~~TRINITY_DN5032_c0_g1_i1.p1  ORF type:complete len:1220 (-),score=174.28 TRINITY_DN5032_c0_g1_i1:289-3906(-)